MEDAGVADNQGAAGGGAGSLLAGDVSGGGEGRGQAMAGAPGSDDDAGGAGGKASVPIPEKFRVVGEDGSLDLEASAAKLVESYQELSRRMGEVGLPPEKPEDYKVARELPEGYEVPEEDLTGFLKGCHSVGLTKKQVEYVLGRFGEMVKSSAAEAAQSLEHAEAALKETWGDKYETNLNEAKRAFRALAGEAGLNDVEMAEVQALGNSPALIKLLAAAARLTAEDGAAVHGQGATAWTADRIAKREAEILKEMGELRPGLDEERLSQLGEEYRELLRTKMQMQQG